MNKEKLETIFSNDLGTSYFPLLAEEYLDAGDYDRALKVLDIGLLLNPDNNDGKYIKAKIAMIHADSKVAVSLLKEILDSDDLYINAMKMLALHYQSTGSHTASLLKILNQILDLSPGDEFALGLMKSLKKPKKRVSKASKKVAAKKPAEKKLETKSKKTRKKLSIPGKSTKVKSDINPKMATLTFVDILIKQKQYTQATNLLKVVNNNKSISKDSIAQRQKKIKMGLSKES
tara:strand:- start:87 stop:782 length:696 start_codon:yes stop_codon:yes gene_type:complete